MLQRRHARFGGLSHYRRNRRWTFLSAKAQRTKECAGRSVGSIIADTAADQRAQLGKAFARHDALSHSKNSAAKNRRRSKGRGRASLGSSRHGRIRSGEKSALPRELLRGTIGLSGQVPLNLRLKSSGEIASATSAVVAASSLRPSCVRSRSGSPSCVAINSRPVC